VPDFKVEPNLQPYIKVHGSSNWETNDVEPLLVIRNRKVMLINQHPVLRRYLDLFVEHLSAHAVHLGDCGACFVQGVGTAVVRHAHGMQKWRNPHRSDSSNAVAGAAVAFLRRRNRHHPSLINQAIAAFNDFLITGFAKSGHRVPRHELRSLPHFFR